MGCRQSKENGPLVDKDVNVKRKLQVGLHLAKDEAGLQVAFCKTCHKKYGHHQENIVTEQPTEVVTDVYKYKM